MNTQHTPGPWTYEAEEVGFAGAIVATTGWICDFDTDPSPANARLIAAAPDLLEALKGLDEAYCRAGSPLTKDERHEDRMRLIAARAAIAKATGEQA